jgi:large subunit ribosomal protein L30
LLKITLKKSLIGFPEVQRRTAAALGLTKVQKTVLRSDNDAVRGMVFKLRHVVECETVPDEPAAALAKEGTK